MQVKGVSIRSILQAVENIAGKAALEALLKTLSPESQRLLAGPILVSTYFPISLSSEIHVGIRNTLGKGTWDMNRQIGAEAARIDFKGIYKVFLRMMDYDATLDRLESAWKQYNSQGEVQVIERQRDSATVEVTGVSGFNEGQWISIAGRIEAVMMLCGAKSCHVYITRSRPTEFRAAVRWIR